MPIILNDKTGSARRITGNKHRIIIAAILTIVELQFVFVLAKMGGKLSRKSNEVDDSVKLSFVNSSGRVAQVMGSADSAKILVESYLMDCAGVLG